MSDSQEQVVAQKSVGKIKTAKESGDLIMDTAVEVESLTKTKALNMATALADTIEHSYLKLGGVLKVIFDNAWFEGYESFDLYVFEKFGFASRKARYLMEIYDELVTKQIPWDKVQHLGWTKLKDLAKHLTLDNLDEWVGKAENCTVVELQAMLKAKASTGDSDEPVTSNIATMKFKLLNDQVETVTMALNKAKAECNTEHDNVALEMICAGYVGGNIQAASGSMEDQMKTAGWEQALTTFSELFPEIDLEVTIPE